MESAASVLGVVHANHAPAAAPNASNSLLNTATNNETAVVNMLGQGIIVCSDNIG